MAGRYNRYRSKARSYASRGRSYAKRAYAKSGLNMSTEFLIGLAGAFCMPANPNIDMIAVAGACAPVRGFGKIKGVCQGYSLGQALQHYLLPQVGIRIPDLINATSLNQQGTVAGNYI